MKALKIILTIVVVIVALFLLVAAFLPSEYRVERSLVIEKPTEIVYGYAVDFNHRLAWDPWLEKEPEAETVVNVAEGSVGSSWEWEGETLGSGRMAIQEVVENEFIRSDLEFLAPQKMKAEVTWGFESIEEGTRVTWAVGGALSYPLERYFGLMMDKTMGGDLEKGLANLKREVESQE